ncbi:MAG: Holliday junction resolvase RuvX [Planctomycetota bacterium]|nr:Holliday junction resolvase RuvX [Planctomycetota bacterium]
MSRCSNNDSIQYAHSFMRYLCIDLGDKRTGLAVGDDVLKIVTPAGVLEISRGPALVEAMLDTINEHDSQALVLGMPLHMDGSEGDRARIARDFANDLNARIDLPIHFQDERLTSYAADQQMAQSGRTHRQKKQIRDALAAAEILRDFFDQHP